MDQQLLEAVVEVNAVAGELGIGVVLVGALVMEFTAEVRPSYPQPKMTNDADFAVLVGNWESFNRLRTELEKGVLLAFLTLNTGCEGGKSPCSLISSLSEKVSVRMAGSSGRNPGRR